MLRREGREEKGGKSGTNSTESAFERSGLQSLEVML